MAADGGEVSVAHPLKNWDFVGRCYDLLKADPLDLEQSAMPKMAFTMGGFEDILDGTASKPTGVDYTARPGGGYDQNVSAISSAYDFQTAFREDGTVTVSDPTGAAFSGSLSQSFTTTRKDTESREKVVTYTSYKVSQFLLTIRKASLAQELANALSRLPTEPGQAHEDFFHQYGTHFAKQVLFGGRATQRISVGRQDYERFLADGVDVKANVSATFEIAKVSAKGGVTDDRSDRFKTAASLTEEHITFSGGTAPQQQMFDMWSSSVERAPAPIEISFEPLHSLLTPQLFQSDPDVGKRQKALEQATNSYLAAAGEDTRNEILLVGDRVLLALVATGPTRWLAATDGYTSTLRAPDGNGRPPRDEFCWTLVDATNADATTELTAASGGPGTGTTLALRSAQRGTFLDAKAGHDDTYSIGDGLTAPVAPTPEKPSAQWTIHFADGSLRQRTEIVEGDYVQLQSRWRGPDDEYGFLVGEPDAREPQRVCAFGAQAQKGSVWRITRV